MSLEESKGILLDKSLSNRGLVGVFSSVAV